MCFLARKANADCNTRTGGRHVGRCFDVVGRPCRPVYRGL